MKKTEEKPEVTIECEDFEIILCGDKLKINTTLPVSIVRPKKILVTVNDVDMPDTRNTP